MTRYQPLKGNKWKLYNVGRFLDEENRIKSLTLAKRLGLEPTSDLLSLDRKMKKRNERFQREKEMTTFFSSL